MNPDKKLVVSGATGFVGSALVRRLVDGAEKVELLALVRTRSDKLPGEVKQVEIGADGDFSRPLPLAGIDAVVHAAARVHVMNDSVTDPLSEFRRVNVEGTLALARQAAAAGVKRFIFLSSIKVNGEQTTAGHPFTPDDQPAPEDPYGLSKLEAEHGLLALCRKQGMEAVIVRPCLVYGPGVKGNFASMLKLIEKGWPLPLGAINNQRSLIALDNLVDLIVTCIDHPAAANEVFLAADGEDLSTSDLLRRLAAAAGKPSHLIPVPPALLTLGSAMLGKKAMAQRLLGSLQVDTSKTQSMLGWKPPLSVDEGLRRCFVDNQEV